MLKDYFYVELRQAVKLAIPLESTTEVISVFRREICPIPGVAPALLGAINQRGRLLWVLDLSELFNLGASRGRSRPQDSLTLVITRANGTFSSEGKAQPQIACVVSSLKGIVPLQESEFQPISPEISQFMRSFVSGITEIERASVGILNINAVLARLQRSESATSMVNP